MAVNNVNKTECALPKFSESYLTQQIVSNTNEQNGKFSIAECMDRLLGIIGSDKFQAWTHILYTLVTEEDIGMVNVIDIVSCFIALGSKPDSPIVSVCNEIVQCMSTLIDVCGQDVTALFIQKLSKMIGESSDICVCSVIREFGQHKTDTSETVALSQQRFDELVSEITELQTKCVQSNNDRIEDRQTIDKYKIEHGKLQQKYTDLMSEYNKQINEIQTLKKKYKKFKKKEETSLI